MPTQKHIDDNASLGYRFVGTNSEGCDIWAENDGGIIVYYIDEGYPDGMLTVWNTMRSKDTLQILLDDLNKVS